MMNVISRIDPPGHNGARALTTRTLTYEADRLGFRLTVRAVADRGLRRAQGASVDLDAAGARKLAAALTEWADNHPDAPRCPDCGGPGTFGAYDGDGGFTCHRGCP